MTDSAPRSRALAGWIAAGLFLVVAAVAGVYASYQHNQLTDVELRLVDAVNKLQMAAEQNESIAADANAIRTNLAVLSDADTVVLTLVGKGATPEGSGRVFLSRSKGVLFAAAKLKPLGAEEEYQLWLQTKAGPVNVGTVRANEQGSVTAAFDPVAETAQHTGFLVTVEAEGGAKAPGTRVALSTP